LLLGIFYTGLCDWIFYTANDNAHADNYTRTHNRTTTDYNHYIAAVPDNDTATADYILATDDLVSADNTASADDTTPTIYDYTWAHNYIWSISHNLPRPMSVVYVSGRW
jgi:hypothetical protein